MKRTIFLGLFTCFLTACAGNPPAWWNPNNRYGESQPKVTVKKAPVVQEQTIDTFADTSYEEEIIAPLPEEEEVSAQAAEEKSLPTPSVLE